LKAYFDPETNTFDLVSSFLIEEGRATSVDGALSLGVDEEGLFHHLSIVIDAENPASPSLQRPAECPVASVAEVELVEGASARVLYDRPAGTLHLEFKDVEATEWARLGPNLVWLALDADGNLAALVVEGVSRDPKGKAQAAWLSEMGND
ncbi:MAG: DUF2283 domain-containing protein, partial [Planctomycetes bacterium]|nr:DUF2283 domain-containing protein [Planctomycetota bacterium]